MLKVSHQGQLVIVELQTRLRGALFLEPADAEDMAEALQVTSFVAEVETPGVFRDERWQCHVTNRDKKVVLVFAGPLGASANRIPMPARAARELADLLRTNANMARHGLRIERG